MGVPGGCPWVAGSVGQSSTSEAFRCVDRGASCCSARLLRGPAGAEADGHVRGGFCASPRPLCPVVRMPPGRRPWLLAEGPILCGAGGGRSEKLTVFIPSLRCPGRCSSVGTCVFCLPLGPKTGRKGHRIVPAGAQVVPVARGQCSGPHDEKGTAQRHWLTPWGSRRGAQTRWWSAAPCSLGRTF